MPSGLADVAIIGLGPTGGVLANLLGQAGVKTVVFERDAERFARPRAAHFDGEAMRTFQALGLDEAITSISRPGTAGMHFVSATGQTLMVRTGNDQPGLHGHVGSWYFHQPDLEAILERGLARFPNVLVERGADVTAIEQGDDDVGLTVTNGAKVSERVRARFVVGCDGARSSVRQAIGTSSLDLGQHQPWVVVDVMMKRPLDLPEHSVQICDPARPMTMVNMAGDRRRWEIMMLPDDDSAQVTNPDRIWEWLSPWITPDDAEIERSTVYTFHSLIAERWRDRRLFIAGDAAHQTPPFLGQGMCAGIRDAVNLAWKLPLALGYDADDSLLDSYQSERFPHVQTFTELAVRVGEVIQLTDQVAAAERDRSFAETGAELFAFPVPQLGPGLHSGGAEPIATPLPQWRLEDAQFLDDVIGARFAVITSPTFADRLGPDLRAALDAQDLVLVADGATELSSWLAEHHAGAVIIRPDRYIAALVATPADLATTLGIGSQA